MPWCQGITEAAKEALRGNDPSRVSAVGVSGQQHGMVVLDSSGKASCDHLPGVLEQQAHACMW